MPVSARRTFPRHKSELLLLGMRLAIEFCDLNGIEPPAVEVVPRERWHFAPCAYYRPESGIHICLEKCASPCGDLPSRACSWPGSVSDRTPYGVVAHELGHHVDWLTGEVKGPYWSDFGGSVRGQSGEQAITSYCPGDEEWFAEMFRLYLTNPALLRQLRPRTWVILAEHWRGVGGVDWREELGSNCPGWVVQRLLKKGAHV